MTDGIEDLEDYSHWAATYSSLRPRDREAIRRRLAALPQRPLFTFVLAGDAARNPSHAAALLTSIRGQLYDRWEVLLPAEIAAGEHGRVRGIPSQLTAASFFNFALDQVEGDYVIPIFHGLVLGEHALYELLATAANHPDADLLFTDEDRLDSRGQRCSPHFKTCWDPDLMLARNAVGYLAAYRTAPLRRVAGMRAAIAAPELALYELALRFGHEVGGGRVVHVPSVACHRAAAPDESAEWDPEAVRAIVSDHLRERGEAVESVQPVPLAPAWARVVWLLPPAPPLVSIIVPTRDNCALLGRCVDGILSRTHYSPIELIIVDNGSQDPATLALLQTLMLDPRVQILAQPGPFNFSALNNAAAQRARGEILLLLNDDTDVLHGNWLRELVSQAIRPDVGAVGAKLHYDDGRIQHAGIVFGPGPALIHQLRLSDRESPGPFGELCLVRTVSAVTGACLAIRRSLYLEMGGLNATDLSIAFNDVELCLRIADYGYRVVWTPFAQLMHSESASRGLDSASPEKRARIQRELTYLRRYWQPQLARDPFHNPNIAYQWTAFGLAAPPRRQPSWQADA